MPPGFKNGAMPSSTKNKANAATKSVKFNDTRTDSG
jgi:hypothetical protein